MIKPKIKTQKIYPEVMLKPEEYPQSRDNCKIVYKEDYLEINCYIDGTGNWFKLPYEAIRGVIKGDDK